MKANMLNDEERTQAFNEFRSNPYISWREVAKKIKVDASKLAMFMEKDRDFRKAVESLKDARDGRIGA